jgi:AcrR family transcriptional regulator
MRVSAEVKANTRKRILETADASFRAHGWDATTTRDIAAAAEIASGTLFNYFPTKEAIGAALLGAAFERAEAELERRAPRSLEEDLFAFVWSGLRHARPFREFATAVIGEELAAAHRARVDSIVERHTGGPLPPLSGQIYWSLYAGLIESWAADDSPHQEQTLALLDHTLTVFVVSLRAESARPKKQRSTDVRAIG